VLPLVRAASNLDHRYALLDAEHLVGVLNLLLLASPAGLALLLVGGRPRSGRALTWLVSAAAPLVLFPVVWNVSFSLRDDWGLFASMGIPLALLGGVVFLRASVSPGVALKVAAISLFGFTAFALANAGGPMERYLYAGRAARAFGDAGDVAGAERWDVERDREDPGGVRRTVAAADALARKGKSAEAEAHYRRALEQFPRNSWILASLGHVLWTQGCTDEAREVLEQAVRVHPENLDARMALVTMDLEEGREDAAVRALERGARICGLHPNAGAALRLLGQLYLRRGDRASAEAVFRLADRR
jgi:Flp pilus assembly protein TadD